MVGLTSAAGLVGFLSEPDTALQSFALQRLNDGIDLLWPEVAGSIGQMYALPCLRKLPTGAIRATEAAPLRRVPKALSGCVGSDLSRSHH